MREIIQAIVDWVVDNWPTMVTWAIVGMILLIVSGCQTKETSARFMAAESHILQCVERIARVEEARMNKPVVMFADERNALIYLIVEKMASMNDRDAYVMCDDAFIAMTNADSQKTSRLISGGTTLGGVGLGLVGVKILADGLNDLTDNGGTTGDTWTVNGSRVVNGSASSSASGDGLGQANSFNRSAGDLQGVSGFEPRSNPVQTDSINDNNPQSASGTNEPAAPIEAPEVLPSE